MTSSSPDLLHYMASNAGWMNELGDAFVNQQVDIMTAIQALRGQVLAAGSLVSNDQQQVIVDGSTIEIVPANPQIIYLPVYDPQVVYVVPQYPVGTVITPRIRFGAGIRVGDWLHHDFDWDDRAVYVGSWGADRPCGATTPAGRWTTPTTGRGFTAPPPTSPLTFTTR